ncbi:uncharacterized protein K460DRAFT_157986 [Cucurbitaria berberidis CBS 394.84]|uniref:Uncharacterized protein n=1 Tax=Cucurbitaria berberidis CBS 394.84 TaxID=1168544 RepID=A0A9P4GEX7_9PLEO|nr:uncharacterized protein K460DRAFT_157986 [Cucurbitaria berberidis CBS 394.84]KAF1844122.1 hypothetical protein K460DRAFT_157986 [Cucurbitaria berberidis CBS 394.84]
MDRRGCFAMAVPIQKLGLVLSLQQLRGLSQASPATERSYSVSVASCTAQDHGCLFPSVSTNHKKTRHCTWQSDGYRVFLTCWVMSSCIRAYCQPCPCNTKLAPPPPTTPSSPTDFGEILQEAVHELGRIPSDSRLAITTLRPMCGPRCFMSDDRAPPGTPGAHHTRIRGLILIKRSAHRRHAPKEATPTSPVSWGPWAQAVAALNTYRSQEIP